MLLLATFVLVGCSDDFDRPPMDIPVAKDKPNMTILDLKTKYWNDAKNYIDTIGLTESGEKAVIHGRVVSSDATGNIYKTLVIQDETAAISISINSNSLYTTYRVGQEIVMPVTDLFIGKYNTLQQLGYPQWYAQGNAWEATFMSLELFQKHAELNGLPEPEKVDTVVTTIPELPTTPEGLRKMQSQLVRINNISFVDANGTTPYSNSDASTTRNIQDANKNTLAVRNSNYATFRAEALPVGVGSVVGILSYYNGSWQLLLRSTSDCIGFSNDTQGMNPEDPFTMDKVVELQNSGRGGWMTGYIVGAVAPDKTEVKSNSDVEWTAPTVLANTIVIGATATTKDIKNCVVVQLADGTALRQYANLKDNPTVLGKQIWLNATNFATVLGTYGAVTSGAVSAFKIDGVDTGGSSSTEGTKTSPYTVAQVLNGTGTGTSKWLTGYIVGWVDGMTLSTGAKFTVPATSNTNVLLAASPTETNVSACVPVQLPSGALRTALNLVDHSANLGKQLLIRGDIAQYFGVNGLKLCTEAVFDGQSIGSTTEIPANAIYSNLMTTAETFGQFSIDNKTLPTGLTYVWSSGGANYGAKASAYASGTRYATESWLVSPEVNISGYSNVTLAFDHAARYFATFADECQLMVSVDGGAYTNVTIPTVPAGADWAFVNSGKISIKSGSKLKFAFKYTSTATTAATWEVKNIVVEGTK